MNPVLLFLLLLLACGRDQPSPPLEPIISSANQEQRSGPTPESLYLQCEERVEGAETAGECSVDEDCVTGGCGSEVCTTAEAAKGLMTTCEARPCFQVLEACGCVEGLCKWSLKDELPPLQPVKLKVKLPEVK